MTTTTHDPAEGTLTGIRINVDGTLDTVTVDQTSGRTRGLNKAIGSDRFDIVGLRLGIDVFVDDEGLTNAGLNPVLSAMTASLYPVLVEQFHLHGAGLFLGVNNASGDTISLTGEQRFAIVREWQRQTRTRTIIASGVLTAA